MKATKKGQILDRLRIVLAGFGANLYTNTKLKWLILRRSTGCDCCKYIVGVLANKLVLRNECSCKVRLVDIKVKNTVGIGSANVIGISRPPTQASSVHLPKMKQHFRGR